MVTKRFARLEADLVPEGDGPPLVLLHGQLLHRGTLRPLRAQLGSRATLLVDLPGHGASSSVPFPSMASAADDVHATLAEAGWERPIVVGHSLGALVALQLASAHDVAGVVLVGCPGALDEGQLAQQRAIGDLLDPLTPEVVDLVFGLWFAESYRTEHPEMRETLQSWLAANDPVAAGAVGRALADAPDYSALTYSAPITAVSFEQDLAAPRPAQQVLLEKLGAAEVMVSTGHMGIAEAPAEVGAAIVEQVRALSAS